MNHRTRDLFARVAIAAILGAPVFAQDWVAKPLMSGRNEGALSFDAGRGRLVAFGGWRYPNLRLAETWEWNGTGWARSTPATSPTPRTEALMVFDAARSRTVLFGGDDGATSSETWEWDGVDWTQRSPATSPAARRGHVMAYDAARGRVVLFGGESSSSGGLLGDTWEWDGNNWLLQSPATSPQPRRNAAMAYDPVRGRVVLFGGSASAQLGDTWEWDGAAWVPRAPAAAPSARESCAMAYDAARQRMVLFGGRVFNTYWMQLADTWEWDGSSWTARAPAQSPRLRSGHGMAYDATRQQVVMFGGEFGLYHGDLWAWDGNDWIELASGSPSPTTVGAMAYDPERQRSVLFDGSYTWEWDGARWQRTASSGGPGTRQFPAMAYDPASKRVLLFGGYIPGIPYGYWLNDTWAWDGVQWTNLRPARQPIAMYGHEMATDVVRGRVVLFGGLAAGAPGATLDRTYEWDGVTWSERFPTHRPPARTGHMMVFDPVRQRTVLYGGRGNFLRHADTWEWDGTDWTQRFPSTSPPHRYDAAMFWDTRRARGVMFGGSTSSSIVDETWEWDGNDWILARPDANPGPQSGHAMSYHANLQRAVMAPSSYTSADTWVYGTTNPAVARGAGAGCAGTAGVPVLGGFGTPRIGAAEFAIDLQRALPSAPAVHLFALAAGNQPLGGGCSLLLDPSSVILTQAIATNGVGFATLPLPVGLDPSLVGARFYVQSAVVDPAGPYLGLALSRQLKVVIGD